MNKIFFFIDFSDFGFFNPSNYLLPIIKTYQGILNGSIKRKDVFLIDFSIVLKRSIIPNLLKIKELSQFKKKDYEFEFNIEDDLIDNYLIENIYDQLEFIYFMIFKKVDPNYIKTTRWRHQWMLRIEEIINLIKQFEPSDLRVFITHKYGIPKVIKDYNKICVSGSNISCLAASVIKKDKSSISRLTLDSITEIHRFLK